MLKTAQKPASILAMVADADDGATRLQAEPLVSAEGVEIVKGGRKILHDVAISVCAGEIVTLIGPNGAGKTTLARVLLGLEKPTKGDIVRHPSLRVGYAPQKFDLDSTIPLTARRFLMLGASMADAEVEAVLEEVGAGGLSERQLSRLSGGEFQRVLLARALLRQPNFLVLDEPVRGVDYLGEADLYKLIGAIRTRRGCGILLISHDLHVVMSASDRVVCVNQHICCQGVPESVAQHPEYQRLFGTEAARSFALYRHAHDHSHDLDGGVAGSEVDHHHGPHQHGPSHGEHSHRNGAHKAPGHQTSSQTSGSIQKPHKKT
jgi:zinc transport system ATP-binding protein